MYHINVTEYLDENINDFSDSIAVIEADKRITFSNLFSLSKELSIQISKRLNGQTNKIVAILLPKGINSVIANLAVMYSGNAYMNLDTKNPKDRLNLIIAQVKPELIISEVKYNYDLKDNNKWFNCFERLNDYECPFKDNITEPDKNDNSDYRSCLIDTDPCCVINTSGSTGVPKAVILNHRSFIDFIEAVKKTGFISRNEVIGSLSPTVFDIYSFELCMLMAWGATMVVIPDSYAAFPAKLLQLMSDNKVSYAFWVPTIMVNIANMKLLDSIELPYLRMVWFAGEVFPTAKFNYWRKKLSQCRFVNFYGPIEITLDCLYHEIVEALSDDEPIPIGKPFRNTSVFLLDEENKPAKTGEEGELYIRGSSLAMGYLNNEVKTNAAFIQNPLNSSYPELVYKTGDIAILNENGDYIFKGRKDTLIKRLGYRIELSEIEHVLVDRLKIVKNCCVLYSVETKDLILVYEAEEEVSLGALKKAMGSLLPKYMIPTKAYFLSQLPRNQNGKIDRNLLKEKYI